MVFAEPKQMAPQAIFWYNKMMKNIKNPLALQHPWEILEQQANEANFIVISGLAVDVDDLIDAIHGREIDPILTRAELNTAYGQEYNVDFLERVGDGMKRRIGNMKAEKKRRISVLLQEFSIPMGNGVTDIKLPRREQILIVLSRGKLRYNSLTEFLGQFAELTEKEAGLVADTVTEVRGDVAEVEAASKISARKIREVLPREKIDGIEQILDVNDVGDFPIFLLERAVLEIPPHEDDYQYFEEILRDRGVHVGFVVESTIGDIAFGAPMLAFAGSVISISTGWLPKEVIEVILSPTGAYLMGGGAAMKLAQNFSKWTPITDRLRARAHTKALQRSSGQLQNKYRELAGKVEGMKKTAKGRLNLLGLKELVLAHRDGGEHERNRVTVDLWIQTLKGDPSLAEQFEDFARTKTRDFDTFSDALKVWEEFRHYQIAVRSVSDIKAEPSRTAQTARVVQARLSDGGIKT